MDELDINRVEAKNFAENHATRLASQGSHIKIRVHEFHVMISLQLADRGPIAHRITLNQQNSQFRWQIVGALHHFEDLEADILQRIAPKPSEMPNSGLKQVDLTQVKGEEKQAKFGASEQVWQDALEKQLDLW